MQMRCSECGLIFDDRVRSDECPHEELDPDGTTVDVIGDGSPVESS